LSESHRERWDRRWAGGAHADPEPPAWLDPLRPELPAAGRALDVACGAGRAALWLARAGFEVTAVDVSPVALERCRAAAERAGLSVTTRALDLEREPPPEGPFAAIACFAYLQRDLFPRLVERLSPGGCLVCEIATVRNLERHRRPPARFLLEEGELRTLVAPLEPVYYREGWFEGRALARAVARRAPV
jgi:tellurite methyltransferase